MNVSGAQGLPTTQDDLDRIADALSPVNLSGTTVAAALAVFVATLVLARLARRVIRRYGTMISVATPAIVDAAARLTSYLVVALGAAAALSIVGIDLIPLLGGLGLVVVIAALALRSFLENFAAGMSLYIERPIALGDHVLVSDIEGRVEGISARTVLIRTPDGKRSYIPNREVLDHPIVNYSAEGQLRSQIDVGLAYDTDLRLATALMIAACEATEGVRAQPPPEVFVHEFADSTINARVRFWHDANIRSSWVTRHHVVLAVKDALDAHDIEIAFPQRVLWDAHRGAGAPDPA